MPWGMMPVVASRFNTWDTEAQLYSQQKPGCISKDRCPNRGQALGAATNFAAFYSNTTGDLHALGNREGKPWGCNWTAHVVKYTSKREREGGEQKKEKSVSTMQTGEGLGGWPYDVSHFIRNRSTSLQIRRKATKYSHAGVVVTISRSWSCENEYHADARGFSRVTIKRIAIHPEPINFPPNKEKSHKVLACRYCWYHFPICILW